MAIQKTEAFVLRAHPFRTSSLLVTFFSRDFGKLKGLAKGVRKEGIVHPSTFEPFTLLEIVFYEKVHSEIHLISEATVLASYEGLRRNLPALATAYYLAELTDELTELQDPHESLFELLQTIFQSLPSLPPSLLARYFEVRLLSEIGLLPPMDHCLICGRIHPEKLYFSPRQGTVLCERCRQRSRDSRPLRTPVIEALRLFMRGEFREGMQHPMGEGTLDEIGQLVERFLADRLAKPLKARRFLNRVLSLTRST